MMAKYKYQMPFNCTYLVLTEIIKLHHLFSAKYDY